MIAKLLLVVAAYIALSPHIATLKPRLLLVGLTVGVLSGLVGTATRLEPASMIPVNFGLGVAVAVAVTAVLHLGEVAIRGGLKQGS